MAIEPGPAIGEFPSFMICDKAIEAGTFVKVLPD